MADELKPCPLCGGAMSIRTNRDWHRLVGEHSEDCLLEGFEPYFPAIPKDRDTLVSGWNRRSPSLSGKTDEGGQQT